MKKFKALILMMAVGLMLGACTTDESDAYEITLMVEGETYQEVEVSKDGYIPDDTPEKDSMEFTGWTLDEDGILPAGFPLNPGEDMTLFAQFEEAFTDTGDDDTITMLENAKRFTPMIDSYDGNVAESGGSGVVYKKEGDTYFVLTNQHVVDGYEEGDFELTFFLESEHTIERNEVTLHGTSVTHDLAVLSFESSLDIPVARFADVLTLKPGQKVYSLGSPLDLPNTITMGIISATDRAMTDEYGMNTTTVQHTASINAGNSGGALVNEKGKVVGINVMSYVDEYVGEGIEGLHFAVQSNIVESTLPSLESN
ncbi:MAG: S1C family serine protease [Bacillota bacterium]